MYLKTIFNSSLVMFILLYSSCRKEEFKREINIQTDSIIDINTNRITAYSTIIDLGSGIESYGHCWDTNSNPQINNSSNDLGKPIEIGVYGTIINDLKPATKYFLRSYASNQNQIVYGEQLYFETDALGSPNLRTGEVREIDTNYAIISSELINFGDGLDSIIQHGHCWSLKENPTIHDLKSELGRRTEIGYFIDSIIGLSPGLKYYVKSYAINEIGITYGEQIQIKASDKFAEITLSKINSFTDNSINYSANIVANGGFDVTSRGICWSTEPQPTIIDNRIINGNGIGVFNGTITGLSKVTTYYVRAFATNFSGTNYSNQIELKTLPTLPIIITQEITNIDTNGARLGGVIIDDGGEELIEKGIYWSVSSNPTDKDNVINAGKESSNFSFQFSDLHESTQYFIRAFATNRAGTSLGEIVSFVTYSTNPSTVFDINGNQYNYRAIGEQFWMVENLKTTKFNDGSDIPLITNNSEWNNLSTPAYCWAKNDEATYKNPYGALYNWYTVKSEKICPLGWHVPSDEEWKILTYYVGGTSVAGGNLKEIGFSHWESPNEGASDDYGFAGLPGGFRGSSFFDVEVHGYWWSSTLSETEGRSWIRELSYHLELIQILKHPNSHGLSIRCIRD